MKVIQGKKIPFDHQRKPVIYPIVVKEEETLQTIAMQDLYAHMRSEHGDDLYDRYPPMNGRMTELRFAMLDIQKRIVAGR